VRGEITAGGARGMMRLRRHWGDDGRSGEHRVPLRRGGGSGFGRSVDDDLGRSSLFVAFVG
jgi:hypothetical protein